MTNILLISHELIPSVRLCGYEQFSLLRDKGQIGFRYSPCRRLTPEIAGWADAVFFVRADSKAELLAAKQFKAAGKLLFYILDDDLPEIPEGFSSSPFYRLPNVKKNILGIMELCDGFVSPSAHLREKYGKPFRYVIPVEEPALFSAPIRESAPDEPIRVGFAGSTDRSGDVETILGDTVRKLVGECGGRVTVEFFGAKPAFVDELGLRHIPYCDSYDAYRETMCSLGWDIGLSPMPDTEFHRGKHYNKFSEYAAAGIVGVYSDLPPYHGAVTDGVDGLLCPNTTEAFTRAILSLVNDREKLARMKAQVRETAQTRFSLENVTVAFLRSLDLGCGLFSLSTDHAPLKFTKKLRRIDLSEHIANGIRLRGFFGFLGHACVKVYQKIRRKGN